MRTSGSWHRIIPGMYRYTNAAGKVLADVHRYRGYYLVDIYPLADDARHFRVKEFPRTVRDAKDLARREYLAHSRSIIKNDPHAV